MELGLKGRKVAILATDGVEQVELVEPRKALDAAGAVTHLISPKEGAIQGMNHDEKGDMLPVDQPLSKVHASEYDALLLPGGVANPGIYVTKGCPNLVKRTGRYCRLVNHPLKVMSPFAGHRGGTIRGRFRRFVRIVLVVLTCESNPVQSRLRLATSGDQVHRAVGTGRNVGDVQRPPLQKDFQRRPIAAAARRQLNGQHATIRPIEHVQRVAVGRRELQVGAEHRGRR